VLLVSLGSAYSAPPGFYRVYMAHNRHMLAFAAMNRGESRLATETIRDMLAAVPADWGPTVTKYRYVYSGDHVMLVDPGTRTVVQEID